MYFVFSQRSPQMTSFVNHGNSVFVLPYFCNNESYPLPNNRQLLLIEKVATSSGHFFC